MRKMMYLSRLLLMAGFLFLYACKKNGEEMKPTDNAGIDSELMAKVNAWLEEKKAAYTDSLSRKIETLKQALVSTGITVEDYRPNEKLVIVPVSEAFTSANNIGKDPGNYLVMVLSEGKITKGNLIQYVTPEGRKRVPPHTFSKIFTYQKLACDGIFALLSLTDRFSLELTFEQGRLKSVAEHRSKTPPAGARTTECIYWYLVTTWYYTDGTSHTEESFLYTTGCNSINHELTDDGGAGGGQIQYEYEMTRESVVWTVASNPESASLGEIKSFEKIKGKRDASLPSGGYFTDISHKWSWCNFCSNSNSYDVWSEHQDSPAQTLSSQAVSSRVWGRLQYNGFIFYPDNTKSWSFQDIF